MNRILSFIALLLIITTNCAVASVAYEELTMKTEFGDYDASFFPAEGRSAAIFVPGAKFDKENFHFLAHRLQQKNIASISFDDIAGPAIISAIQYLQKKGIQTISLIGCSRGGGVILKLPNHPLISLKEVKLIRKMVLLAPYGGDCPQNEKISKLFIIAEKDGLSLANTERLFDECKEPKNLVTIPDTAYHAQQLFDTKDREIVADKIIQFVSKK